MKNLIDQTVKDIHAGEQSWRVLMLGSFFSFVTTIAVLAYINV